MNGVCEQNNLWLVNIAEVLQVDDGVTYLITSPFCGRLFEERGLAASGECSTVAEALVTGCRPTGGCFRAGNEKGSKEAARQGQVKVQTHWVR